MYKSNTIVDKELLCNYEFYIWEVMRELRAAEGLDNKKIEEVFKILERMSSIYERENKIDKVVVESLIIIPGEMFLISKEDKEQGREIETVAEKFLEYRINILKNYNKDEFTIVSKSLINEFRESSIGKEGFLTLVYKHNIYDNQKFKDTFVRLEKIKDIYNGINVIDIEVGGILTSIYEYMFEIDSQNNRKNINNFSAQFQRYLRKLFEIEE